MAEETNDAAVNAEKAEDQNKNPHTQETGANTGETPKEPSGQTQEERQSTESAAGAGQSDKQSGQQKEKKGSDAGEKKKQTKKQKKKKDKQTQLQEEIEDLKQQVADLKEKNLRERAELDNFRRRAQKDQASARENGKAAVLQEFFQVYDHLRMAMEHTEQNPDFETLRQGIDMILNEFGKSFENLGIQEINAEGEVFDPNQHEAVAQEPSDEVPEGKVVRQWKCGYMLGDRLLRPATVVVSSGPTQGSQEAENEEVDNASEGSDDSQQKDESQGNEED